MKKGKNKKIAQKIGQLKRQHCSGCNLYVKVSTRYPNYACAKCQDLAVDETGNRVKFFNTSDDGRGCSGVIIDTKEILKSNICFIKGQRFKVEEAYLGGIVHLPFPKRKSSRSNTKTI